MVLIQIVAHFNYVNQPECNFGNTHLTCNGLTTGELLYLHKQSFPDDESRNKIWIEIIDRVAQVVDKQIESSISKCDHVLFTDNDSVNNDKANKFPSSPMTDSRSPL